jgi:hypothetical protein
MAGIANKNVPGSSTNTRINCEMADITMPEMIGFHSPRNPSQIPETTLPAQFSSKKGSKSTAISACIVPLRVNVPGIGLKSVPATA